MVDTDWLQSIEHFLKLPAYVHHPLLSVQKSAILLIQKPNNAVYEQLQKMIDLHKTSVAKEDLVDTYIQIINFCI